MDDAPLNLPDACIVRRRSGLAAIEATGAKYSCNDTSLTGDAQGKERRRFKWAPEPPCRPLSWRILFSMNRTVWIIGDSMSSQAAFLLRCMTVAELGGGRWKPPPFSRAIPMSRRDAFHHRVAECARVGADGARICYLPAGTDRGPTVADVLRIAIEHGGARSADVALLNSGAWQMSAGPRGDAYQRALPGELAAVAMHPNSPKLFWRESYAQHFFTPSGVFDRRAGRLANARCSDRPLKQPPILTAVSAAIASLSRIAVLPTWAMSQGLSEAHRGHGDCSHYCNFGGIIHATLDAFVLAAH